jgi:alpha-beta hydrolase superfamily lysophospholipase
MLNQARILAIVASATCLVSTIAVAQPADAFWPFTRKNADGTTSGLFHRKKREVAATQVGLVPGNPPAMYWRPDATPKAAVLCLHELGMYSGVFDDLGKRMSKNNVATYAIDLRGFGGWQSMQSKEARMDLGKTLADVKGSVEIIRKLNPNIPVFILGEAMGGALALEAASLYPDLINGVISAAPGGEHFKTIDSYLTVAGGMMTGSKSAFGLGNDLMQVATPKADLRQAFMEDEMVRLDLSPRELMSCQFYMYKTKKMAKQIKDMPVMIVHGSKDGESRLIGSKSVYDNLATKDKDFLVYEDGDHYTFESTTVPEKVMHDTLTWIDKHSK